MGWRRSFAVFALAAAAAAPAQSSGQAGNDARPIPAAYLACASDYWRALLRDSDAAGRLNCTAEYLETIPDHAGGTLEMLQARSQAIQVADRYIEDVVVAGLGEQVRTETDSRGDYVMARSRMLDTVVGVARLYDHALCGFVEEAFGAGTYRRVASANCRIRNRDTLIEDLMRARIDITQGIDQDPAHPGPRPVQ